MFLKEFMVASMKAAEIPIEAFRKMSIVEAMVKSQFYNFGQCFITSHTKLYMTEIGTLSTTF